MCLKINSCHLFSIPNQKERAVPAAFREYCSRWIQINPPWYLILLTCCSSAPYVGGILLTLSAAILAPALFIKNECNRGFSMTWSWVCTVYLALGTGYRSGGERREGPPTGKFMGPSVLGQFWGGEFENRWYTGNGQRHQPRFHELKSRSGKKIICSRLKRKNTGNFDQ